MSPAAEAEGVGGGGGGEGRRRFAVIGKREEGREEELTRMTGMEKRCRYFRRRWS